MKLVLPFSAHIPALASLALALGLLSTLNPQLSTYAQGSLTPPGAPAPAMKSLAQIEPRTPISTLPITITNSGSYYVVSNLTGVTTQSGISIGANDVTLDLNGFALIGVTGSQNGVTLAGAFTNIYLFGGTIRNWGGDGISLGSFIGCDPRIEHTRVCNNLSAGIIIDHGVVRDCLVLNNGDDGIRAYNNCLIINNYIAGNNRTFSGGGVYISFSGNQIEGNQISAGNDHGIYETSTGNLIIRNTARGNATTNYSFNGNGTYGPVITGAGIITNNSPWANFSY